VGAHHDEVGAAVAGHRLDPLAGRALDEPRLDAGNDRTDERCRALQLLRDGVGEARVLRHRQRNSEALEHMDEA
jgi:hypothetical protein